MRPVFVADVHVGNHKRWGGPVVSGLNSRAKEIVDALANAVKFANDKGEPLVVLGDLFDTATPSPQMVWAVGEVLNKANKCYVLLGNHEYRSAATGDHALKPLGWLPDVVVIDEPTLIDDVLFIPYQSGPACEWLPEVLASFDERELRDRVKPAVCLHLGIADDETPPWLKGSHDSITIDQLTSLSKRYGFREVYAGNWHKHQTWDCYLVGLSENLRVVQVGALVPTGFDNAGLTGYGSLVTRNADRVDRVEVDSVRYIMSDDIDEISRAFANEKYTYDLSDGESYNIIRAKYKTTKNVSSDILTEFQTKYGPVFGGMVIEHSSEAVKTAAADAARKVESLNYDKVLADYSAKMVGDKVMLDKLLPVLKRYLRE